MRESQTCYEPSVPTARNELVWQRDWLKHVELAPTHSLKTPLPSSSLSVPPSRFLSYSLTHHWRHSIKPFPPVCLCMCVCVFEVQCWQLDVMPNVTGCGRQFSFCTIFWYSVSRSGLRMMPQPSLLRTAAWTAYSRWAVFPTLCTLTRVDFVPLYWPIRCVDFCSSYAISTFIFSFQLRVSRVFVCVCITTKSLQLTWNVLWVRSALPDMLLLLDQSLFTLFSLVVM